MILKPTTQKNKKENKSSNTQSKTENMNAYVEVNQIMEFSVNLDGKEVTRKEENANEMDDEVAALVAALSKEDDEEEEEEKDKH